MQHPCTNCGRTKTVDCSCRQYVDWAIEESKKDKFEKWLEKETKEWPFGDGWHDAESIRKIYKHFKKTGEIKE